MGPEHRPTPVFSRGDPLPATFYLYMLTRAVLMPSLFQKGSSKTFPKCLIA